MLRNLGALGQSAYTHKYLLENWLDAWRIIGDRFLAKVATLYLRHYGHNGSRGHLISYRMDGEYKAARRWKWALVSCSPISTVLRGLRFISWWLGTETCSDIHWISVTYKEREGGRETKGKYGIGWENYIIITSWFVLFTKYFYGNGLKKH
jgi:hypothetical protein